MEESNTRWVNLAIAFFERKVRPGMRIEPYHGPQTHSTVIKKILYRQNTGEPYIEIEPGRHFYDMTTFRFYRVNLDGYQNLQSNEQRNHSA